MHFSWNTTLDISAEVCRNMPNNWKGQQSGTDTIRSQNPPAIYQGKEVTTEAGALVTQESKTYLKWIIHGKKNENHRQKIKKEGTRAKVPTWNAQ